MEQSTSFIHHLVRKRGGSLRHLARDMGISPSTLSRWMSGKQAPSPRSCERLAHSLSLPVEDILAHVGHLGSAPHVGRYHFRHLQGYVSQRFLDEYGDDIAGMIDDIIQDCYPAPCIGQIMFGPQVE